MSRWNRPMRPYQRGILVCQKCGEAVRPSEYGYWTHVKPKKLHDPDWHMAVVS